ncbi:MAG: hypothetical protein JW915_05825 [Chitinispirillaceae bacterium]|nr:hypothetical protein [Chitinispirillaceae bacterium]
MKNKLLEHLYGIVFVTSILIAVLLLFNSNRKNETSSRNVELNALLDMPISNINDAFQQALAEDAMNIFYPGKKQHNDSLFSELIQLKKARYTTKLQRAHVAQSLSFEKLVSLSGMYLNFIFAYIIVMLLTYYGVQTLALWRFIRHRNTIDQISSSHNSGRSVKSILAAIPVKLFKIIAYGVLFSPAYVLAYSIRTEFNTDSTFFMILLGVLSNGLLITYSNKFYTFLKIEYHRGYVESALVKNLACSWKTDVPSGIPLGALLHPRKRFKGHVLDHIYRNAHMQYIATIKEQASFLITGLIIIEMALNIHGHLTYEMLRQILYKNYDIVIVIILGIFYAVKATDIVTDYLMHRERLKYEN